MPNVLGGSRVPRGPVSERANYKNEYKGPPSSELCILKQGTTSWAAGSSTLGQCDLKAPKKKKKGVLDYKIEKKLVMSKKPLK